MSSYTVECQMDGWPVGISAETKASLTREVRECLALRGPLTINTLISVLKGLGSARTGWTPGALWDHQYATIDRACRAADCEQVWRAPSSL